MKKTNYVKLISLLLLIAVAIPMLAACQDKTGGDITAEQTTTADTTFSETPVSIPLIENGETKFTLLMPIGRSDKLTTIITDFRNTFKKRTGIQLEIEYEDQNEAVNDDFEILIGKTKRPESINTLSDLKYRDFFYGIVGNKLVITGGSPDAIDQAIQLFFRSVIDKALSADKENVSLSLENNYTERGNYLIKTLKIGDTDISNFKIVYSPDDFYASEVFALKLRESIQSKVGIYLEIVKDNKVAASEHEIVIGKTNRGGPAGDQDSFNITYENGKLYFSSDYSVGYDHMFTYFVSNIITSGKEIILNDSTNEVKALSSILTGGSENVLKKTGVRILFNNIYCGNEAGITPSAIRAKQLADVYRDYNPDVIGLQEYSSTVKTKLEELLIDMGYKEIPYTNKNNSSIVPRTPIFYNPNTLKLIDSGFWRYNDNSGDTSKSIGWAVFEEKASGKKFITGSTHFWWKSEKPSDNESRKIDATELCEQMSILSNKYDAPVIIGGDYNCRLGSDPINIILKENPFVEAEDVAVKTEFGGTHHNYPEFNDEKGYTEKYYNASGTNKTAIDHIFMLQHEKMNVHLYDVIEDFFALASSDHCPMITDITLK